MNDQDDLGFSYQVMKSGVTLFYQGRRVTELRGRKAADFEARIEHMSFDAQQQLMARLTGNFKRGNERPVPKGRGA